MLDEVNHDGVLKKRGRKFDTIEVFELLGLLTRGFVPSDIVLVDVTALFDVLKEDWLQGGQPLKSLPGEILEPLPFSGDVNRVVSQVATQLFGDVVNIRVNDELLLFGGTIFISGSSCSFCTEASLFLLSRLELHVFALLLIRCLCRSFFVVGTLSLVLLATFGSHGEPIIGVIHFLVGLGLIELFNLLIVFLVGLLELFFHLSFLLLLLQHGGSNEVADFAQFGVFVNWEEKFAIATFPIVVLLELIIGGTKAQFFV